MREEKSVREIRVLDPLCVVAARVTLFQDSRWMLVAEKEVTVNDS